MELVWAAFCCDCAVFEGEVEEIDGTDDEADAAAEAAAASCCFWSVANRFSRILRTLPTMVSGRAVSLSHPYDDGLSRLDDGKKEAFSPCLHHSVDLTSFTRCL